MRYEISYEFSFFKNTFLTKYLISLCLKVKESIEPFKVYGISHNPDTKDYMMVLQYEKDENYKIQCERCGERYANREFAQYDWCKHCQVDYLRKNFTTWTSGNEKIDDFIQDMQLESILTMIWYVNGYHLISLMKLKK